MPYYLPSESCPGLLCLSLSQFLSVSDSISFCLPFSLLGTPDSDLFPCPEHLLVVSVSCLLSLVSCLSLSLCLCLCLCLFLCLSPSQPLSLFLSPSLSAWAPLTGSPILFSSPTQLLADEHSINQSEAMEIVFTHH